MTKHQDRTQQKRIDALVEAADQARQFWDEAYAAIEDLRVKRSVDRSKPYAAAKRASLDLTNALVKVRYPEGRS